jgi:ABC-type lipoprotein release transport system permease subunit
VVRLAYFIGTGLRDARRARRSLLANVFIVAGICLPVILLIGLERGLVEQFRQNILKNATARQIQVFVNDVRAERIGLTREEQLRRQIPGVTLVIPEINKQVHLTAANGAQADQVSVYATKPGNPYLAFYQTDVIQDGERAIVVSRAVADGLKIGYTPGERGRLVMSAPVSVTLRVTRPGDAEEAATVAGLAGAKPAPGHTVQLEVKGVIDPGTDDRVGYVDRQLAEWLQVYTQGLSVLELNWPSSQRPVRVNFDGFLAFIKQPYTPQDLDALHKRGLGATRLTDADERGRLWRTLCGLLRPHPLHVYWLRSERAEQLADHSVDMTATQVQEITSADDRVVAWTPPDLYSLDGVEHRVIGLSWSPMFVREFAYNFMAKFPEPDPARPLGGQEERRVIRPFEPAPAPGASLALKLRSGAAVPLAPVAVPPVAPPSSAPGAKKDAAPPRPPGPPLAVVPVELAAHLAEERADRIGYDTTIHVFVPRRHELTYTKALVYANDLDDVPKVDAALQALHYSATSSKTRVLEMQGYAGTLDVLVKAVMISVLFFGTLTLVFVFTDVTARKRGAIGIMRIMGMPKHGVFCIVLVRSMVVGALGGLGTIAMGYALAAAITRFAGADCKIEPMDLGLVLAGACACCLLGVAMPALRAILINPVDAILIARTQ